MHTLIQRMNFLQRQTKVTVLPETRVLTFFFLTWKKEIKEGKVLRILTQVNSWKLNPLKKPLLCFSHFSQYVFKSSMT